MVMQMNIQVPFGGKKASGTGREFGEYVSFDPEDSEAKCNYAHGL